MVFSEQDADGGGMEMNYTSVDFKRMVVNEWTLYELTHVNEDDILQYKIVGVSSDREQAERYIANEACKFLRVAELRKQ